MPSLAQALPDPSGYIGIGWVLAALFAIAGGALVLKHLFRADPPLHKEYVSRTEHEKFRDETALELKRHAARRAEIYDEQKRQGERLARVEEANKQQTHDLHVIKTELGDLNDRVDAVPERTINLLLEARKVTSR